MIKHEQLTNNQFDVLDYAMIGTCVIDKDYSVRFWNTCLED